jgi:hypothetical protein
MRSCPSILRPIPHATSLSEFHKFHIRDLLWNLLSESYDGTHWSYTDSNTAEMKHSYKDFINIWKFVAETLFGAVYI